MMTETLVLLKSVAKPLAFIIVGGYAAAALMLYFRQPAMIYFPGHSLDGTPASAGLAYEEVALKTSDGVALCGWYVPSTWDAPTVLCFHGNAGDMGDRIDTFSALHEMGYNVFMIDYRGYGKSGGKPTEQGTYLDALAAWNYLVVEKKAAPTNIIVYGRSLGCAIGAWLATQKTPAALVLHSPFSSIPEMAARQFPIFPVRALCRFKYDTAAYVAKVKCPVMVAHSRDDEMVPFEQGLKVFGAATTRKDLMEVEGGHNDHWIESHDVSARRRFQEFVRTQPQ